MTTDRVALAPRSIARLALRRGEFAALPVSHRSPQPGSKCCDGRDDPTAGHRLVVNRLAHRPVENVKRIRVGGSGFHVAPSLPDALTTYVRDFDRCRGPPFRLGAHEFAQPRRRSASAPCQTTGASARAIEREGIERKLALRPRRSPPAWRSFHCGALLCTFASQTRAARFPVIHLLVECAPAKIRSHGKRLRQ